MIPPTEYTGPILEGLRTAGDAGDIAAAWHFVHYLVDLFDYARVTKDANARKALAQSLGLADEQGPSATDRVLDALLVHVDAISAKDRLHAGALAVRTLLEFDRRPASARLEIFSRMTPIKGIARGNGPLAANASLRLVNFCAQAFQDAKESPSPARPQLISYCLYPLYDSDPEPYFDPDPRKRPPEPAWQDLAQRLEGLERQITASKSRISPLGAVLLDNQKKFLAGSSHLMPTRRSPSELGVLMLPLAEPYEWTPLLRLGDGSDIVPAGELAKKVLPVLAQDGRGRVAIALTSSARADALLVGAGAAENAGAEAIELVVGYQQVVSPPVGDYWHGQVTEGKLTRLGVIPLAMMPSTPDQSPKAGQRAMPRGLRWDRVRASLGLHLVVGKEHWQLLGSLGAFPLMTGDYAQRIASLRERLTTIRDAFPDEDGLVLVPEKDASVRTFIEAAAAARYSASGSVLFGALALGKDVPRPDRKGNLLARIERRAAAKVSVVPEALASRVPAIRRCYQEALDKAPRLRGILAVEAQAGTPSARVTSGPKSPALRVCVEAAVASTMEAAGVKSVRIDLK
ncbi:MAG: hypothetical protein HY698_06600 [Deltaproteobacteria bacterium]|nr:hypothetical protein [Deltaproteobacteria bacterium]